MFRKLAQLDPREAYDMFGPGCYCRHIENTCDVCLSVDDFAIEQANKEFDYASEYTDEITASLCEPRFVGQ